jgi:hypothetical protein
MKLSEMISALHHLNDRMQEITGCAEVITVVGIKPDAFQAIRANRDLLQHGYVGYDEKLAVDFLEISGIRFVPDFKR